MSAYLVGQIEGNPKIKVVTGEVASVQADKGGAMKQATLKDGTVIPAAGALFAIGSIPMTDWASGVERGRRQGDRPVVVVVALRGEKNTAGPQSARHPLDGLELIAAQVV